MRIAVFAALLAIILLPAEIALLGVPLSVLLVLGASAAVLLRRRDNLLCQILIKLLYVSVITALGEQLLTRRIGLVEQVVGELSDLPKVGAIFEAVLGRERRTFG